MIASLHQVEQEAANTELNLLFSGGPEGLFFLLFDGEAAPLELKKRRFEKGFSEGSNNDGPQSLAKPQLHLKVLQNTLWLWSPCYQISPRF